MASYVVAASLFVIGSSYLVQFIIQPPGNSTAEGEHQDTQARGVQALNVLLGTPGFPSTWTADHVDRLGLIEPGTSTRIDEAKFDALAHGRSSTQDASNGAVDYNEAKKALGLDGYEFHLRAYPVLKSQPVPPIKAPGMKDYHVAYVGGVDANEVWTSTAKSEASALENISIDFKNDTRTHAANGDVYQDDATLIRDNLLPQLGNAFSQSAIAGGVGTAYDLHRVNASVYSNLVSLSTVTTAMALSSSDGKTLGYTPGREIRSVVGGIDLTGQTSGTLATLSWKEWVDTDHENGSYDCNDHGFVEVSPDNGATWVPLTNDPSSWSQDCATAPHAASMSSRSTPLLATSCAACADDSNVLVAFHWVADLDSLVGYGWVVDDLSVVAGTGIPTPTTLLHKTFEAPAYDMLVIGSNADQGALDHADIKDALRSYVNDQGGRLLVLGGPSASAHWLDPLVGTAQGTGGGSVGATDTTHPILTIPYELDYGTYAAGTPWQFTGAQTGLFTTVLGDQAKPTLAVSKSGAWSGGTSNDGSVVLTSFAPAGMSETEARMFFANMMVFGRYHSLYLELGPKVPDGGDVATATRSGTMNKLRNGSNDFGEIAFVMYVWNGTTVDASAHGDAEAIPASPVQHLTAESTNAMTWVNFSFPVSAGTGTPDHYEVWRTSDPTSWSSILTTIPWSSCPNTCSYHDTSGISNGVTYYYNVTLVTAVGRGSAATPASTTPMDLPGVPTGLLATSAAGAVRLSWTAPTATGPDTISGYGIYSKKVGGSYSFLAVAGNATTYSDVVPDTDPRMYTIAAINGRGWGANTTDIGPVAALTPAQAPVLTVVNTTAHELILTWTLPGDLGGGTLAGYTITRNGTTLKELTASDNRSWIDQNLHDNVSYTYTVRAVTEYGDGLASDPVPKATLSVPWQVTGLVKTSSVPGVSVTMSWDAPLSNGGSPVLNYEIWGGEPGLESFHGVSATTSFTDTVAPGLTYKVRANNSAGSGPWSDEVQMGTPPGAPVLSISNLTDGRLILTWTDADPGSGTPDHYVVSRSDDGGSTWSTLKDPCCVTGGVSNGTWIDQTVTQNASYSYKVHLVTDTVGADDTASKQVHGVPWQTKGLARTGGVAGTTQILGWSAANDAGSAVLNYEIWRGASSGSESFYATSATAAYTDLAGSSDYWYKVRANNSVGSGAWSDELHAITPPGAPTLVSASNATSGEIDLVYTASLSDGGATISNYSIDRSADGSTWSQLANFTTPSPFNGTWADKNISANTTYYYRAFASNSAGASVASTTRSATSHGAPWTPSGLATVNTTAAQITLSWNPFNLGGGTFQSYTIQRTSDGGNIWLTLGTSIVNNNSWIDLGLSANTTYSYRIYVTNDVTTSATSASVSGLTLGAPWQVNDLARSGGSPGVSTTISWSVPNNGGSSILLYTIYRGSSSGTETLLGTTTSTSYTDASLTSYYWYNVSATNAVGEGPRSTEIYAKTVPAAPSIAVSNSTAHHLIVTVTDADMGGGTWAGARIQRSTDGSTWTTLATWTTHNSSWDDATVSDNTTYYYQVANENEVSPNWGSYSSSVSKASAGKPWAPTGLARTGGSAGVSTVISWNAANTGGNALTAYDIYRGSASGGETFLASVSSSTLTYTDATLSSYYWYNVTAENGVGQGPSSSEIHALTTPAAPTVSVTNGTAHRLDLAITAGDSGGGTFSSFTIQRSTDGSTWTTLASDTSSVNGTWLDATITDNSTYYYRAAEVTDQGTGTYSSSASKQAIGSPWTVQGLALTNATAGQLGLTWSTINLAGGAFSSATIQRSTDGSTWSTLATSSSNNATWTDATVAANTTYYYRVAATDNAGTGSYSSSASLLSQGAPWIPQNVAIVNTTANRLDVSWDAFNLAGGTFTSYTLQRSTDGSTWSNLATSTTNNATWLDLTIANNTTYYYRLTATNGVGTSSASANASKQAMGAPWQVKGLAKSSSILGVSITMSWTAANTGGSVITAYHVFRDGVEVGTSTLAGTSYTDVVANANSHNYQIQAENAVGKGILSATVAMTANGS